MNTERHGLEKKNPVIYRKMKKKTGSYENQGLKLFICDLNRNYDLLINRLK